MTNYIDTTTTTEPQTTYDEVVTKLAAAELSVRGLNQSVDALRLEVRELNMEWSEFDTKLREAADNAGLCSQYDDFVTDWNNEARRLELTPRTIETEVAVSVTFTMTSPPEELTESAEAVIRRILDFSSGTAGGIHYCDIDWEISDYN